MNTEKLNNSYSSPNTMMIKSKRVKWASYLVRMGYKRNAYKVLVGKPGGKRTFRKPRHRWESNIEIEVREIDCRGMGLI
jgi:hypothetical protein